MWSTISLEIYFGRKAECFIVQAKGCCQELELNKSHSSLVELGQMDYFNPFHWDWDKRIVTIKTKGIQRENLTPIY